MTQPDPRGRRAGLSREVVLSAAVELLDAHGLKAFTLRALAARLEVDPMAIYWHLKNKDEILDGVVALVLGDIGSDATGPWHAQAASMFRAHRARLLDHPAVLELLLSRPIRSADAWAGTERLLTLLEPELGGESAARWLRHLASYTNGFLLTERGEQARHLASAHGEDRDARRPRTARALKQNRAQSDRDFEHGLAYLVDGMRTEVRGDARAPRRRS